MTIKKSSSCGTVCKYPFFSAVLALILLFMTKIEKKGYPPGQHQLYPLFTVVKKFIRSKRRVSIFNLDFGLDETTNETSLK